MCVLYTHICIKVEGRRRIPAPVLVCVCVRACVCLCVCLCFWKLPRASGSFPEASGSFPELPEASRKLLEASQSFQKLPGSVWKLPRASGSFPRASGSFPEASGSFPELPEASRKLPETSQELPEASQSFHESSGSITPHERIYLSKNGMSDSLLVTSHTEVLDAQSASQGESFCSEQSLQHPPRDEGTARVAALHSFYMSCLIQFVLFVIALRILHPPADTLTPASIAHSPGDVCD